MRLSFILAIVLALWSVTAAGSFAQTAEAPAAEAPAERINPNNQTLADVLARQRGEGVPRTGSPLGDSASANMAAIAQQFGTGALSSEFLWKPLRFSTADVRVSTSAPQSHVLIQPNGVWWLDVRRGPLLFWGGVGLLAMIGVLAVFYAIRGTVRIESGRSGRTLLRFTGIERFAHWLIAVSFLLLAFSGLITLAGRKGLIPLIGHEAYSLLATGSKWVHNNVAWAFMVGLIMVFVFWIVHNIPNRGDLEWLRKGGGIVGHAHPPAKKFNAGQKLIFWSVVIFGASISISGLSLLFPYQLPLFGHTFSFLNDIGIGGLVSSGGLPERLVPHEEMQYAQLWHAIIGFVLMAIIIAHIYIGTLGMEGAFEAMGSGEVDLNWAHEHHSLWAEKELTTGRGTRRRPGVATPAE